MLYEDSRTFGSSGALMDFEIKCLHSKSVFYERKNTIKLEEIWTGPVQFSNFINIEEKTHHPASIYTHLREFCAV